MFLPKGKIVVSILTLKFTIKIPDTIKNMAKSRFKVSCSPKSKPESRTPDIGMMKIKECNDEAPNFFNKEFHAKKPNDAVTRL